MKKPLPRQCEGLILGFAAGVMSAAGIWSLLLPALEQTACAEMTFPWLPPAVGLALGVGALTLLDRAFVAVGGHRVLLPLAITLHNVPEGMAVGLGFAMTDAGSIPTAAWALALGIGIQNFPEGAAISLPLHQQGADKKSAFGKGALSGIVEPAAGMGVFLAVEYLHFAMPWLLGFAAGAMLYVVVEELIPRGQDSHGCFGFTVGFLLMMVLDVALG